MGLFVSARIVIATECCNDSYCDGATCKNPGSPCPPEKVGSIWIGGWGQCSLGGTNCGIGVGAQCPSPYTCVNGDCVLGSPAPSGGGGGGTSTACGNAAYPACSGVCSGGDVCKAIAATGSCNCAPPASCSDYVPTPNLLPTVRVSPTTARLRWSALDTATYPYVERIALVVEDNAVNFNLCKQAALLGNASANCVPQCTTFLQALHDIPPSIP